jgi:hypothetical protein
LPPELTTTTRTRATATRTRATAFGARPQSDTRVPPEGDAARQEVSPKLPAARVTPLQTT